MSSSTLTVAVPKFMGEARHKVEGKNRITVPSGWRFPEEVKLYMIQKPDKPCLSVLTLAGLERLERKADEMEPNDRTEFLEMLGSCTEEVTLDKGGRITLPIRFFALLGLPEAREVCLAGATNSFTIWSVENFDAKKAAGEEDRHNAWKRRSGI